MEILGKIEHHKNRDILHMDVNDEKSFNDSRIALAWVAQRYHDNGQKYGTENDKGEFIPRYLYEAEPQSELRFVDVDVFRQAALHFKKYQCYTTLHKEYDRKGYDMFWDREEHRRKHGMTAWAGLNAKGELRKVHITGEFYGFLNYAPMKRTIDDSDVTNADVIKYQKKNTTFVDELLNKISDTNTVPKGTDFPSFFDGQYHISIARMFAKRIGKNFFYGKKRRAGQSYWNAWCACNNADMVPKSTTAQVAFDIKYLNTGEGALFNMVKSYADHLYKHTDWSKHRLIDTQTALSYGYIYKGENIKRGFQSEALALSAGNNPDCLIGKDCIEVQCEELGKFPNYDEFYDVTTSTTEAGDNKVGFITGWGTGGTKDANWLAFENICYHPDAYDSLPCNNVWDEGAEGTACCYFYPHIQSLEGHMDANGNTNYDSAWKSFLKKKDVKKITVTDDAQFMRWCGQRANCPSEAFARDSNNIFPTEAIQAQLNFVLRNQDIKDARRCGVYIADKKVGVKLATNESLQAEGIKVHRPVEDYPIRKGTDVYGCIVEWQGPWRDKDNKVPPGLYVAFQDPYGVDKEKSFVTTKNSLGTTYVYECGNKFTGSKGNVLVASYIGRPDTMDHYNGQVALMLERYNATLMFENDRGDVIKYMRVIKKLHRLCREPEMQFAKEVSGKAGRGFGMHMTEGRINRGLIYLRDLLTTVVGTDPSTGKDRSFLSYIYDAGFLRELLKWNKKGNFDRVSAFIIGMYIIKELEHIERLAPKSYNRNSFFNREFFN